MLSLFGQPRFANHAVSPEQGLVLLAVLACREDGLNRDELSLLLWNDTEQETGRHRLRQLLYRTRALPHAKGLETTLRRVRLNAPTDVQAFRLAVRSERWADAIALYTGELLERMRLPDQPELESFFSLSREEFAAQYRYAVLMQAAKLEPDAALALLDSALERDPLAAEVLRESLRLAAQGRAEIGKRIFGRFVRAMQALDLEIDEDWWAMHRQLETSGTEQAWLPPVVPRRLLPAPSTVFVGREPELQQIQQHLGAGACRLLTLHGSGGVGKTRLALHVAHNLQHQWRDGAVFVALAALSNAPLVPNAMLEALQVTGEQSKKRLLDTLSDKDMLLVLDNLEQLLGAPELPNLIAEILHTAPEVRILATSRELLGLPSEQVLELSGFAAPQVHLPLESQEVAQVFLHAARRVKPDFLFAKTDAAVLQRIYLAVSGMPLGLELAASWVRVMSLHEIADSLEQNLDLLEAGEEATPERHRSFAAIFASSWRWLAAPERLALGKLALFRGGFSRESAEAVAGCSTVLLLRLVNKSLVNKQDTRFYLHEMIRQYAERELPPKERQKTLHALAQTCLEWAMQWRTHLNSPRQPELGRKLEQEHDNIRTVLDWALQHAPRLGAEIAGHLDHFWFVRGHHREGLMWLERFLENKASQPPDTIRQRLLWGAASLCKELNEYDQAKGYIVEHEALSLALKDIHAGASAQRFLGLLICDQGEPAASRAYLERARVAFEALGDTNQIAICYSDIGNAYFYEGNSEAAKTHIEKALVFKRQLEDKQGIAYALAGLSNIAAMQGDDHTDRLLQTEALRLKRELGDAPGMANSLFALGDVSRGMGEFDVARGYFNQALELYMHLQRKLGVANLLLAFAQLEAQLGQFDEALRLGAAALALLRRIKVEPRKSNLETIEQIHAQQPYSEAQRLLFELEGERMGLEEVVLRTLQRGVVLSVVA